MKLIKLTLNILAIAFVVLHAGAAEGQRIEPSGGVSSASRAPIPMEQPINLPQLADLQIVKSVGVVPHGSNPGTFVIVVTNNGPGQATGPIVINDTLTGPATIIPPAPAGCAGIPGTSVTCTLPGPLNAGQSLTLTFTTAPNSPASGMAQNCATVRSASRDNNDANNRDCTCMDFKRCFDTTIDISTGSNNGNAIPIGAQDSHWSVVPPSGGPAAPAIAIVRQSGSWILPPAGTQWISQSATATAAGTYAYKFNYNLGNDWPNRECRLSLQYAVDNDLVLKLGNTTIASSSPIHSTTSFSTLHSVSIGIPSTGSNTITANVNNAEGPTGLLIKGQILCSCKRGPVATD